MRQNACGNYSLDMRRSLRSSTYRNQRPAPRPSWRSRLPPPSSPSRRTARTPKWLQQTIRHHQHLTGGGSGYSPERVRQTATASIQRIGVAEQIAAGARISQPQYSCGHCTTCGSITLSPAVATVRSPPARGTHQGPRGETVAGAARRCRTVLLRGSRLEAAAAPERAGRQLLGAIVTIVPSARETEMNVPR